MKLLQSTQLLTHLDSRYLVNHPDNTAYSPELRQPVGELRAIIAALPPAVEAKRSRLEIVCSTVIEYITAREAAENLLTAIDNAGAMNEPFGTVSEQLREQQVNSGFTADSLGVSQCFADTFCVLNVSCHRLYLNI